MPWASYQIRKIAGCACAGNAGNVSPRRQFQRKPLVSDPGMHHGTCVTHVPWCMSGSLTCDDGENVPGIPGACAPAILRIWQEAHGDARSPGANIHSIGSDKECWDNFAEMALLWAFNWHERLEWRDKYIPIWYVNRIITSVGNRRYLYVEMAPSFLILCRSATQWIMMNYRYELQIWYP